MAAAASPEQRSPDAPAAALVLAADAPAALAGFYAALLACEAQHGLTAAHWLLPLPGGGRLEIYAPSRSRPRPRGLGRLTLCLRRPGSADSLQAWIDQACRLGATLLEPPRSEPFGWEAWLLDPEGNGVLLLAEDPADHGPQPAVMAAVLPEALAEGLGALAEACSACRRCALAEARTQVVVSRGNPQARLMVIGEGPGAQEDAQGQPFVGRSGQLLDRLLERAGLDSNRDAYVCNVVKCRPPDNRKPTPAELAACRPWLERQITLVDPAVILLAGSSAVQGLLGLKGGITRLRGHWQPWQGRWVMPILHPSYLLRYASEQPGSPRWHTLHDLEAVQRRLTQSTAPL